LINGCDVLISTPQAFISLTDDYKINIIDRDRLKHALFDSVNLMISKYEDDVIKLLKFLSLKSENLQVIVKSETMCSRSINNKILKCIGSKSVIYFDNFLEAAAFVGMKIIVKITSSNEDKMKHIFPCDNFKGKTLIFADDYKTAEFLEKDLNARNCNAKIVSSPKSMDSNILILTDNILRNVDIRCVDNLIHFSYSNNTKAFSKRFIVFTQAIYERLRGVKHRQLECLILFNDSDIIEYLHLMNFLRGKNLLDENDQHSIEVIFSTFHLTIIISIHSFLITTVNTTQARAIQVQKYRFMSTIATIWRMQNI
jgi:hypothetical protein